jgi:hypothetical protein
MPDGITDALIDAAPALLTAVVTVVLGAAVGGWISTRWELAKKRREIDLAAADAFYGLHGEFVGIWRQWSAILGGRFFEPDRQTHRLALFTRACDAQARVEALVVKLAIERILGEHERALLGCYRQAYRTLLRCLEADRGIGVGMRDRQGRIIDFDDWNNADAPSYQAFKELTAAVGAMIGQAGRTPDQAHSRESLRIITDNIFERPRWVGEARHRLGLPMVDDDRLNERAFTDDGKLRPIIHVR